jgi:hypothetical protein
MNWSLIIKINIMVFAFIGVLWIMRQLQTEGPSEGLAAVLGANTPQQSAAITTLDWCETRVQSLEREGKPKIHQVKLKWFAGEEELSFIPVEKWFGRYCRVNVERVPPEQFDAASAKPAMKVSFIKGEPVELLASGELFKWDREVFRSAELAEALTALDDLPKVTRR